MVEVLAIIPARGGSKSIPHKNIRLLNGHPLIAYSIAAGRAAHSVNRLIVSTDDEEIADIAEQYGAEVPFLRPAALAQDDTPDLPVFHHVLRWLQQHEGYEPGVVVQLRPTSPFRRVKYIDDAVRLLSQNSMADSVRTVCVPFQNPYKMWRIAENGWMRPLLGDEVPEPYNMPRQKLPTVFWQTGYVDAARCETLLNLNSMTGRRILPLVIEESEWIDIDSPADWTTAELLLSAGLLTQGQLGFDVKEVEPK